MKFNFKIILSVLLGIIIIQMAFQHCNDFQMIQLEYVQKDT